MKYQSFRPLAQVARASTAIVLIAILSGCFGGSTKPQPAELQAMTALVSARQSWNTRVGQVNFPLELSVAGNSVGVAVVMAQWPCWMRKPVVTFGVWR